MELVAMFLNFGFFRTLFRGTATAFGVQQ